MGSRGAAAFALPSPSLQGCTALPDHPQGRLWDGTGEGESQICVFGNISPALLSPSCPSHPGVEPLEPDSSSMTLQSLTLWDVWLPLKAPACSAIPLVQSRGIIHISDKRIGY